MTPRWTRSKERTVTVASRVDGVHLDEDQYTAVGFAIASVEHFFFNDTATTEIYTLSLHDALPIYHSDCRVGLHLWVRNAGRVRGLDHRLGFGAGVRLWRGHRGCRLVGLLQQPLAAVAHLLSATTDRNAGYGAYLLS